MKKATALGLITSILFSAMFLSSGVFAGTNDTVTEKAMLQGLARCLPETLTNDEIVSGGLFYTSFDDTEYMPTNASDGNPFPYSDVGSNRGDFTVSAFKESMSTGHTKFYSMYSCHDILFGHGMESVDTPSIMAHFGKDDFSTKYDDSDTVVKYLGYEPVADGGGSASGNSCISYTMSLQFWHSSSMTQVWDPTGTMKSQKYCFNIADGKVSGLSLQDISHDAEGEMFDKYFVPSDYGSNPISYDSSTGEVKFPNIEAYANDYDIKYDKYKVLGKTLDEAKAEAKKGLTKMVSDLYNYWYNQGGDNPRNGLLFCENGDANFCYYYKSTLGVYNLSDLEYNPPEGYEFSSYGIKDPSSIAEVTNTDGSTSVTTAASSYKLSDKFNAIKTLTGAKDITTAKKKSYLTYSEKIILYQEYLIHTLGIQPMCGGETTETSPYAIRFYQAGNKKSELCSAVDPEKEDDRWLIGVTSVDVDGTQYYKFSGTITPQDIFAFLRNIPADYELEFESDSSSDYYNVDPTDPDDIARAGSAEAERTCYDSAGSANWIVCPIIDNGSSASTAMYGFIEKLLQTNTSIFRLDNKNDKDEGANGTFVAWGKFRDYANIAFIIVFVVVILSQVTGMGIDNYGVKKILPKLILGALLVNISYFVCQIAVDSGNLVGGGVKDLFNNIIKGIGLEDMNLKPAFDGMKAGTVAIGVSAAAILAAIIGAAWYFSGGGIVVPILLGVIGIVIGIIFLLVMLAVRQGLAVILTVASPLAFIAYMLPNTRTLFNKWLKLFAGTLLAYPICSAVVYGGQMVSSIIIVSSANGSGFVTNFALLLTAGILSIAPVFFIPTLITKSMGGIATVANGLKARATSMGKGAFERSHTADKMRDIADMNKDKIKMRSANRAISSFEKPGRLRNLLRKANGGKPIGAELAVLRNAQRTKSGIDKKNEDLYGGMTKRMDKADLEAMIDDSISPDHFNAEQYAAAMTALAKIDQGAADRKIAETAGHMKNKSKEDIAKWKNTNVSSSAMGKAMSKVWNTNQMGYQEALTSGELAKAFSSMGDDALAKMDPDEIEFWADQAKNAGVSLQSLFSAKQVAAAAAAHNSGKGDNKFRAFLSQYGDKDAVANAMTAEQWSRLSNDGGQNSVYSLLGFDGARQKEAKDFAQQLVDTGDGQVINSVSGTNQRGLLQHTTRSVQEVKIKP